MLTDKILLGKCLKYAFISIIFSFMLMALALYAKEFDSNISGPQMIVEPDTIRLGIARLKDTNIVFRGKVFQPEDSVFIILTGVKKDDKIMDIPIADGDVDKNGNFTASVSILVKVNQLLRAKIGSNENMETVIIISQPPIPEGVYTVKAISMESDIKAECKLLVKGPSVLDSIKDWIGGLLGKIVRK